MKVLIVAEGKHELCDALEVLVRRLRTTGTLECDRDRVSRGDIHSHHGKGRGYYKRAIRWMYEAKKRGYDALIFVIDEDHYPERVRELAEAQEYAAVPLRRALGVAIHSFDAWMLSDEKALSQVLNVNVSRQPDPESIADPKGTAVQLRDAAKSPLSLSQMYSQVAHVLDLQVLEHRCPKGFAPFARRVREL